MQRPSQSSQDEHRINEFITATPIRLIDPEGEMLGVVPTADAIKKAQEFGLDLVEISPNASPPVCKILDYGKFRYEVQKKAKEAKKKQKVINTKEIKLRPTIDIHDYEIKVKAIHRFIGEGDKVKVSLRFRGREMANQGLAFDLFHRLLKDVEEIAKVESSPRLEGKQLIMVITPK